SYTSPYTRKVRIVLAEKNIPASFELDLPWSPQTRVPAFNPLGKVPVLVQDDGSTLFDSRVIVEYLDFLQPTPPLYGDTPQERIAIKRWEALADGAADAAAAIVIENRRVENERSAAWISRQQTKLEAALAAMSSELGNRSFCAKQSITLADIAVGATLGFIRFRLPQLDWQAAHPNLAALLERLSERASFIDTVPHD
ncbi:MAG: hypothetical protein RIR70_749, partial [Pseudomonadota bacterium]